MLALCIATRRLLLQEDTPNTCRPAAPSQLSLVTAKSKSRPELAGAALEEKEEAEVEGGAEKTGKARNPAIS